jgi:membrane protease YdiL (CAAX protease family)
MTPEVPRRRAVIYALIALCIFAVSRIVYSAPLLFLLAPILIVLFIERRSLRSIGFVLERERIGQYACYALLGFLSQVVTLGLVVAGVRYLCGHPYQLTPPENLLVEFLGQLYLVGLPEEVYYRGYLQTRLGDVLGERAGLLGGAAIFGIAHLVSRVELHGMTYLGPATVIGFGAFLGALVFGYLLIRARSLYPSIVGHIATNMFASGIVAFLLGPS